MTTGAPLAETMDAKSVAEMRSQLGRWLRLARPVSDGVVTAVLTHPEYARRLAVVRDSPEAVAWLIARPPSLPASAARMVETSARGSTHSSGELVGRVAKALLRWTAGGLRFVDEATRERRWAACRSCGHLIEPPDTAIYRIVKLVKPEAMVCDLCGCVAAAKVRLPQEQCPDVHPDDPSRSRWGELREPEEPT